MKLSQKDKSLILFIVSLCIVLWGLFSLFSFLIYRASYQTSALNKILITQDDSQWFNVVKPLTKEDLQERLILLDFWSYSCVYCIQSLPKIKELRDDLGSKLTVIGIHSARFESEKDAIAVKKAIVKYDIDFPVINDADSKIANSFDIKSWPTYLLISPQGKVIRKFSSRKELKNLNQTVIRLANKFKYRVNRESLPILAEKYNTIGNVLSFPTKLEYTKKFSRSSQEVSVIFVANSSKNKIYVTSLNGDIILKVGSGINGFEDGGYNSSSFNMPQGLLYKSDKLYVADTGNNALRVVDFKKKSVSTLIGSGEVGNIVKGNNLDADDIDLASPTSLEFFPDENHIAIANAGTNQILSYNIKNHTINVLAGDGSLGMRDGKYPNNSLAQTSDISYYNKKLYFTDVKSSSLRVLYKDGEVKTLIGQGLNKFGHKNGSRKEALMQNPSGLEVDDTGVYIVDSFNNVIRKYSFSSNELSNYFGSQKKGEKIGSSKESEFDEPSGIISILNRFYVADSNNNRIVSISRRKPESEIFNVMPPLKLTKEGFLQYLPNLEVIEIAKVKSNSEIKLKIELEEGWKINEKGPSFVNLLEVINNDQANLITSFDWNSVKNKEMRIPRLESDENYVLQGTIYFCEDKENALCYIKSYEQKIDVDSDYEATEIKVKVSR